jgi:hypothetical protein
MERTELTPDGLMRQAPITIEFYLSEAKRIIDKSFGDGFSKKNPQLVGYFVAASAIDFHTTMYVSSSHDGEKCSAFIADAIDNLAKATDCVANAIEDISNRERGE